jgi:hypothetical protein
MDYIRLNNLRNTYPAVSNTDASPYYDDNGNYITRYGLDKQNVYLNYDKFSLETLQVLNPIDYPYVDFAFIVQFFDDETGVIEEWTSAPFKKLLEEALKENNPYFNRYSVTIIPINYGELKNHHKKNKFAIGEKYAEVEVTKTISSIEEMLLHIQWLTVFTDQFRNTNSGIKINDPKYPIDGIGNWKSVHNPKGDYGFGWSKYVKQTLNDKVFAEEIASNKLVPDVIPPRVPSDLSLPIQTPATPTPTEEPKPAVVRETPARSVTYNERYGQYYPSTQIDNNGDIIRLRGNEYR